MTVPGSHRAEIVIVNGPAGVGKSTVSKRLATAAPNGICIHGDALRDFVVTRDTGRPAGLSYLAAAALTDVYLAAGFDRIVVDYIFEEPSHVDRYRDALSAACPHPLLVTLWAPLADVRSREATRSGRDRLGERVDACWSAIHDNLHRLGTVIDAAHPIDHVVDDIELALAART